MGRQLTRLYILSCLAGCTDLSNAPRREHQILDLTPYELQTAPIPTDRVPLHLAVAGARAWGTAAPLQFLLDRRIVTAVPQAVELPVAGSELRFVDAMGSTVGRISPAAWGESTVDNVHAVVANDFNFIAVVSASGSDTKVAVFEWKSLVLQYLWPVHHAAGTTNEDRRFAVAWGGRLLVGLARNDEDRTRVLSELHARDMFSGLGGFDISDYGPSIVATLKASGQLVTSMAAIGSELLVEVGGRALVFDLTDGALLRQVAPLPGNGLLGDGSRAFVSNGGVVFDELLWQPEPLPSLAPTASFQVPAPAFGMTVAGDDLWLAYERGPSAAALVSYDLDSLVAKDGFIWSFDADPTVAAFAGISLQGESLAIAIRSSREGDALAVVDLGSGALLRTVPLSRAAFSTTVICSTSGQSWLALSGSDTTVNLLQFDLQSGGGLGTQPVLLPVPDLLDPWWPAGCDAQGFVMTSGNGAIWGLVTPPGSSAGSPFASATATTHLAFDVLGDFLPPVAATAGDRIFLLDPFSGRLFTAQIP